MNIIDYKYLKMKNCPLCKFKYEKQFKKKTTTKFHLKRYLYLSTRYLKFKCIFCCLSTRLSHYYQLYKLYINFAFITQYGSIL